MNHMKVPAMLDEWVEQGWAVENAGDGAWAWTQKGVERFSTYHRYLLSNLAYGRPVERFERKMLERVGLDADGRLSRSTLTPS